MKIKIIVRSVYLLILLFSACKKTEVHPTLPRPVYTFNVKKPSANLERSFSGQLEASQGSEIAFEVGGRVISVLAKEGKVYSKNTVLARLDSSDYQNELNNAKARLTQSEQELRRVQRLFESGNASQSKLDSIIAEEKAARANFNLAQKKLRDCTLTMPYDGVIANINTEVQQIVNGGQTIMNIQGEKGMEFKIGIPVDLISTIKTGMPATIQIGGISEQIFKAEVTEISLQISQNTTYPVTLKLEQINSGLRSGMDGEAFFSLPNPSGKVILIPLSSILSKTDSKSFVWKVQQASDASTFTVNKKEVTIGQLRKDGQIEILRGLQISDTIVSRGVNRLEENTIVTKL